MGLVGTRRPVVYPTMVMGFWVPLHYPAGKAWMDISSHGDAEETKEAKRIIEMEKAMEQKGVKCFVVMANGTDLTKFHGARVQAIREENLEQWWPCRASQVGAYRRLVV